MTLFMFETKQILPLSYQIHDENILMLTSRCTDELYY